MTLLYIPYTLTQVYTGCMGTSVLYATRQSFYFLRFGAYPKYKYSEKVGCDFIKRLRQAVKNTQLSTCHIFGYNRHIYFNTRVLRFLLEL